MCDFRQRMVKKSSLIVKRKEANKNKLREKEVKVFIFIFKYNSYLF